MRPGPTSLGLFGVHHVHPRHQRWQTGDMKRATVTLPDELEEALEAYRRSQDLPLSLTALTQAALRKYLEKRGFLAPSSGRSFGIPLSGCGSGKRDVSAEHDRYLAEATER